MAHNEGSSSDPPEAKIPPTSVNGTVGSLTAEKGFSVTLIGEHLSHREVILAL